MSSSLLLVLLALLVGVVTSVRYSRRARPKRSLSITLESDLATNEKVKNGEEDRPPGGTRRAHRFASVFRVRKGL